MMRETAANEADPVYLDRASYLEPRLMGRPLYRVNPRNILPLLEEQEKETFPKVYLRIKPSGKINDSAKFAVSDEYTLTADVSSESVVNCSLKSVGNTVKHQYKFSKIFGPTSTQKQLFRETCLQPLKCFLRGENCLLFAYGATNAGKTYTIQGTNDNPGIIPQSINMIFSALKGRLCNDCRYKPHRLENVIGLDEERQEEELRIKNHLLGHTVPTNNSYSLEAPIISNIKTNVDFSSPSFQAMKSHLDEVILNLEDEKSVTFSLWVSFFEIHNEVIYDLLDTTNGCDVKRKPLSLGYVNGLAYIKDIRQIYVSSPDEAYRIYLTGRNNLQKAATALNSDSSRSHCVFSIKMVRILNSKIPQPVKVSVFSCVDLAGTERVKKTLNVGNRLRESQNINTSLYVLGRCLSVIRDNQRSQRKMRVPFRDSKLTQVFQYALTGNQGIAMIVNITFDPMMYLETVNVLKFSALARQIVVEPQNNSSFFNSTSMLNGKVSLMKSNDTLTASFASQSNDCNHIPVIKKLQQQLEKEHENNRQLETVNKQLARQLEAEKEKNKVIDARVRQELTVEFSSLLQRTEDFWQKQVKSATEDEADMGAFRLQQLTDFYDKKLMNAQDEMKRLQAHLKESKQEIDLLKAQLQVQNTDGGDIVSTLREQVAELMKELHNKHMENQVLTEKIEEAKDDFILLEENRKSLLKELTMDQNSLVERNGACVSYDDDTDDSSDCDIKIELTAGGNDDLDQNSLASVEACDVISQDDSDIVIIDD